MVTVNLGVLHYVLDHIYGAFVHRMKLTPLFFSRGWGGSNLDLLESIIKQFFQGISEQTWPPDLVDPVWRTVWETKTACLREGVFRTPCDPRVIGALPPESHKGRVAFLTPKSVSPHKISCVVHLAGALAISLRSAGSFVKALIPFENTGTVDHTFERRLRLGGPLLKENIATMVLESPFYGQRRPKLQHGGKLLCVSDLLLLGKTTIEEARSLLYWLEAKAGYGKTGICGISMGGVHAAMVGSLHPAPIATLPFLAPHSAAVAFCEGILKHGTAWEALRKDAARPATITDEQVLESMRSVLSLTDVTRFPVPKNPEAVIFVAATDDGYIPKHSVLELQKAWPGSEVRWVTGGHVSSFLLHNDEFRKTIIDALNRVN